MVNIFLAVFTGVLLLITFKFFSRFGVTTLVAIVINYAVAAITGIIFLETPFEFSAFFNSPWSRMSVPLGALFVGVFYLISQTAQRISISTASVSNKMSVAMPVFFSVIYLHEQLSVFKIVGIVLALLAVYLSSKSNKEAPHLKDLVWLPVLVFIGSGLIDISINAGNAFYIKSPQEAALFSVCTFISAFFFGVIAIFILLITKAVALKELFQIKNLIGGIALGIPNYFSIYFIFKSLESAIFSSAQLFPVLNLSNVVLSAIVAVLFFKERLSVVNISGIILAILSIILIAL